MRFKIPSDPYKAVRLCSKITEETYTDGAQYTQKEHGSRHHQHKKTVGGAGGASVPKMPPAMPDLVTAERVSGAGATGAPKMLDALDATGAGDVDLNTPATP